jgi:hypothetical protein
VRPLNKELQEKQAIDENIGEDADFAGLPDLIAKMIDGVDKGLLDHLIGDDGRSVLDEGIHPQGQMKEIRIIYF